MENEINGPRPRTKVKSLKPCCQKPPFFGLKKANPAVLDAWLDGVTTHPVEIGLKRSKITPGL